MLSEAALRKEMLSKRRQFAGTAAYAPACEKICARLAELPEYRAAANVMLYLPLGGEADVTGLARDGKNFFVPVTRGVIITPAAYTPDMKLTVGEYGVTEPESPAFIDKSALDLVIVPAVAADVHKNRMGFGKGCYDRFLADMDCVKAAVCFDFQVAEALNKKPHDVAMDCVVTESRII